MILVDCLFAADFGFSRAIEIQIPSYWSNGSFQSGNRNEDVSLVTLIHFVFSDCSSHSITEYAALFIVLCFNFWKCTHFCINIILNDQIWKCPHLRWRIRIFWSDMKTVNRIEISIFQWIMWVYYFEFEKLVQIFGFSRILWTLNNQFHSPLHVTFNFVASFHNIFFTDIDCLPSDWSPNAINLIN